MNFKHVLIIAAVVIVGIVAFQFFTRTDRSDPMAVANGFTAQVKDRDFEGASEFVAPDLRAAWLEAINKRFETMKSGSMDNYFDSIPEIPGFTAAAAGATDGRMNVVSADKSYSLELAQFEGDWYVAKAPN